MADKLVVGTEPTRRSAYETGPTPFEIQREADARAAINAAQPDKSLHHPATVEDICREWKVAVPFELTEDGKAATAQAMPQPFSTAATQTELKRESDATGKSIDDILAENSKVSPYDETDEGLLAQGKHPQTIAQAHENVEVAAATKAAEKAISHTTTTTNPAKASFVQAQVTSKKSAKTPKAKAAGKGLSDAQVGAAVRAPKAKAK